MEHDLTLFFLQWMKDISMKPQIGTVEIFLAIIGSGILSTIVGGIFNTITYDRNIEIKNITDERAKWRESLRTYSVDFLDTNNINERTRIRNNIALKLNPEDQFDRTIILIMDKIQQTSVNEKVKYSINGEEQGMITLDVLLIELIQVLLKYDWERSKRESKPFYKKMRIKKYRISNYQVYL